MPLILSKWNQNHDAWDFQCYLATMAQSLDVSNSFDTLPPILPPPSRYTHRNRHAPPRTTSTFLPTLFFLRSGCRANSHEFALGSVSYPEDNFLIWVTVALGLSIQIFSLQFPAKNGGMISFRLIEQTFKRLQMVNWLLGYWRWFSLPLICITFRIVLIWRSCFFLPTTNLLLLIALNKSWYSGVLNETTWWSEIFWFLIFGRTKVRFL